MAHRDTGPAGSDALPAAPTLAPMSFGPLALPEDPLRRLDQAMSQSPEWAELRAILEAKPPFVRNTVCNALNEEVQRAFQNVVGQLQALTCIREWMGQLLESDEAAALNHLMLDIHPSNIDALQREADGIKRDMAALRCALETRDIHGLQSRAQQAANKAKRFRDKYAEFRPKLDRLQNEVERLAADCAERATKSDNLIAQSKERQDRWVKTWTCLHSLLVMFFFLVGLACARPLVKALVTWLWKKIALNSARSHLSATEAKATAKRAAAATAKAAANEAAARKSQADAFLVAARRAAAMANEKLEQVNRSVVARLNFFGALAVVVHKAEMVNKAEIVRDALAQASERAMALEAANQVAAATAQKAGIAVRAMRCAGKNVSSLEGAIGLCRTQCMAAAPFLLTGLLLIALALLGHAGRGFAKNLLEGLWLSEIQRHQRAKATFQHIEQGLREAARKLQTVCKNNEALETALDFVVGAAEDLAASAEDALQSKPEEMEAEVATLHEQIQKLCCIYEEVPQAIQEMCSSLQQLQPATQQFQDFVAEPSWGQFSDIPAVRAHHRQEFALQEIDEFGQDQLDDQVDDEGWILISSAPLEVHLPPADGTDCLPRNTYILIPVAEAARLGALFAAGPNGNSVIEVQSQGQATRLLRRISFSGAAVHELTADHPIRVMRSGTWIQEHASTLQVGDIVRTSDGRQEVKSTFARMSLEEVFSLEVQNGGEIYVCTPTRNSDGNLSWSGVAVLGSVPQTQRSRSAPPRWPSTLPSVGSRLCKGGARCSNMCRSFQRGSCAQGKDCRFCHFVHPDESKRQPRGARDGGSSRSSQSA